MKILARLLLISAVITIGSADFAQAGPYAGIQFPSDEMILKSLNPNDTVRLIGRRTEGPGEYKYFIIKKMPNGKDVIVSLPVIQLDNGIWVISDGAGGYVMINQ